MSISTKYDPALTEDKWYKYWMEKRFFHSEPDDREPYTIVMPPPNVTGVLHMGHMLNATIQDILIRKARMQGKNACWVPGTDHASIATEAKVVAMLKERGIDKKSIGREEFMKYAWEWKEKYGGIILDQLKKLGASCDWERTRFTMEEDLSEAVIDSFIHLYEKGLIYRGIRMVNWDPAGKTAVSDEEVIRKEVNQQLYYIKYQIVADGSNTEFLTVATTRPETIMADAAICVNPYDERFKKLNGKKVLIPLINREIPVIMDAYVDMEFGTGCLKVTPAHDLNDYELGLRHRLPVIDILNDDGTLNETAEILVGEDRFIARKMIAKMLEKSGNLDKVEPYKSQVGFSERTGAAIEPKLSLQWFCKMDELAKPALKDVMEGAVNLIPEKFENTYRHWMENVKDWCVSRQLWWGQRIPAWYGPKDILWNGGEHFVIAKTRGEAEELFRNYYKENGPGYTDETINSALKEIRQEDDVLDTWFSSWLWPISVFDGFKDPNNKEIQYYYPTNDLVTAPEILFFWVARMIMAGHEFMGKKPFTNVYLTGIVRDKLGRKMSKSLGNSPDPIGLIEQYGADGVRVGMLLCSPAGNDLMFDESYVAQGRNFANKVWNAFRLVKGWEVDESLANPNKALLIWFDNQFVDTVNRINKDFDNYRLSEALMKAYKLVWDVFCGEFLENIKPEYQKPIDRITYDATIRFFEKILILLHPFMPFITEELWESIEERNDNDRCIIANWNIISQNEYNDKDSIIMFLSNGFEYIIELNTNIARIRNENKIPIKQPIKLVINSSSNWYLEFKNILTKRSNVSEIEFSNTRESDYVSFILGNGDECSVSVGGYIDKEIEILKLKNSVEYLQGFLKSVNAKLSNEKFVQNAKPEIILIERNKKEDAEAKIDLLTQLIENLGI